MSLPYRHMAEVAEAASTPHCRGIDAHGQYCEGDHRRGFVRDGTVHLSDRRVTRSSIRQFSGLAAEVVIDQPLDGMPSWRARWLRCSIAEEICRERLRVRIPNQYWDLDRWTVRAQLASVPVGTPQRAEAMAWATLAR